MARSFQGMEPTLKLSNVPYHTQMQGTVWKHMNESHLCTLQAPVRQGVPKYRYFLGKTLATMAGWFQA